MSHVNQAVTDYLHAMNMDQHCVWSNRHIAEAMMLHDAYRSCLDTPRLSTAGWCEVPRALNWMHAMWPAWQEWMGG